MTTPRTFTLEQIAGRSANYYERLNDAEGLPYFNVFWVDGCCEAVHDWPDFGDVMTRQLQGAIMLRRMTGQRLEIESVWHRKMQELINPADGMLYRPATAFSKHEAHWGDAALTLYTIVTAWLDNGDEKLRETAVLMVETLLKRFHDGDPEMGGFLVKSLMMCVRHMDLSPALELSRLLVARAFVEKPIFTVDNKFPRGGHMHISLRTLVGAADYALYVKDVVLFSRVDALYRFARSTGTRFGFLPECVDRKGDIIICETCALMDFAGLGVTLANHGHPEYWGDMERLMRNQLVESQLVDTAWLASGGTRPDTFQFTWRDIGERSRGAYAGWSSPTQFLACRETLNAHWGGPELRNKTRALQNCCGGSGVHALYLLWKNAALIENGILSVNLHLDKKLPGVEIRSFQPYQGLLRIELEQDMTVRVRIPDFVEREQLQVQVNGRSEAAASKDGVAENIVDSYSQQATAGNFLELGQRRGGDVLEITYPLALITEKVSIGNRGYRHYHYEVTWKGDTVLKMRPEGTQEKFAYSDFDKKQVEIFYGEDGPARLYQRDAMGPDSKAALSDLVLDDGALNFWKLE